MLEGAGIKCMLNELSSTVVFERPTEEAFIRKWQLACEGREHDRSLAYCVRVNSTHDAVRRIFAQIACFSLTFLSVWRSCPDPLYAVFGLSVFGSLTSVHAIAAGTIAHVVVMPNISIDKLETFVAELIESRSRVAVAAARSLAASARAAHEND